jgi:hypothetical protein
MLEGNGNMKRHLSVRNQISQIEICEPFVLGGNGDMKIEETSIGKNSKASCFGICEQCRSGMKT